ncbi:MAG: hypothetical protein LBM94_03250 [Propionibacteriaceae bacterium]|jgi:hypothetical protein|nr:hypothetical protein [Propionibacteriaceae bacterium]
MSQYSGGVKDWSSDQQDETLDTIVEPTTPQGHTQEHEYVVLIPKKTLYSSQWGNVRQRTVSIFGNGDAGMIGTAPIRVSTS